MKHRAIEQVLTRAEDSKSDSDFTYFFTLLLAAEALAKLVTLGIVSALADDKDRNRYRLEHFLVRSDGLGDWARAIDDALTGPASQYLLTDARREQTELTRRCGEGDWQYDSVRHLRAALIELGIETEELPTKTNLKRWFHLFATLRNKTRAHGATPSGKAGKAATHLHESILLLYNNHALFDRAWVYLHRNLSGKYRVSAITEVTNAFDYLKTDATHNLQDGVYVHFRTPKLVSLLRSDPELQDFFFPNGGLTAKRYELLSYGTDDRLDGDAGDYWTPPGTLPPSETEGRGELFVKGNCFSNAPDLLSDYVARPRLEEELIALLLDERHPIITLVGRGGIGKTSLSVQVVNTLCKQNRYDAVVWLSARDVDLKATGPKPVRPTVLSAEDMSELYAHLVLSQDATTEKGFNARAFFESQLQKSDIGACLFVCDNFETTQNPVELYNWIDSFIRLPNKVLITTRLRDFKGDYPVEVKGMEEGEARELVDRAAGFLGIRDLLDDTYVSELIERSEGHPYVIKILLGEVAKAGHLRNVERVVAGSDDLLTVLFERTYASLSPCAQRAFMTLAAWNSSVPRVALEAVLIRSVQQKQEIEKGVESLLQFSIAEVQAGPTPAEALIGLPLVARVFGKKKLNVSPFEASIQSDVDILQMLGPAVGSDVHVGMERRLSHLIENVSARVDRGESLEKYFPILEMICRAYNPGWLLLARWHSESGDYEKAIERLKRFLENDAASTEAAEAWRMLAYACYKTGDGLGEIHAFIKRAQISTVPFHDISNTANRLNQLLREHGLGVDQEEKRQLAQRLLTVLDKRRSEAGADDLSRMAWLAIHMKEHERAMEYAKAGLAQDPNNIHCRRILERVNEAT